MAVAQLRTLAAGEHLAEYLVDVTTEADRQGNGAMFAEAYSKSSLKRDNDRAVKMLIEQDTAAAACLPGKKVGLRFLFALRLLSACIAMTSKGMICSTDWLSVIVMSLPC